jgi:hypothetical protein
MTAAFKPSNGRARVVLCLAAALAVGCSAEADDGGDEDGGGDDALTDDGAPASESGSDDAAAEGGTIELSVTLGGAAVDSSNLVDPPIGTVFGGIFRSADVGATGPREGAEQFAFVEVTGVDLSSGAASAVVWTSEPLPPDTYIFLGFFDVDDSSAGAEEKEPESGDPVTLPSVNKVEVEAGATAQMVASFDLVLG